MNPKTSTTDPSSDTLLDAKFPELPNYRSHKVRDSYQLPDGRRLLISTDRQSAFDQVLAAVPHKGQVLTQLARYWFDETTDVCPNHVISYPDPNVTIVKDLRMLPVEIVVRAYLTGSTNTSLWPMYEQGERTVYGHKLPDGMTKNQQLAEPIVTPTTKPAAGGHDEPITESDILRTQLVSADQWHEVVERSLALFARGQQIAADKGLILVDTKYEFGVDSTGTVVIADEIHTPDSSRYWIADTYQERFQSGSEPDSLDKEFLRLWISSQCDPYTQPIPAIPADTLREFSVKYVDLYERITGQKFSYPDSNMPVRDRVRESLARELPEYF